MEPDGDTSLLVIACRFVPYDQWLITHLDTSWRIKQVKLWFLSKFNLLAGHGNNLQTAGLDLPRYRPISPITFATGNLHPRGSLESGESGEWGTGAQRDGAEVALSLPGRSSYESFEYAYSYGRNGRRPTTAGSHSQKPSLSGSEAHIPGLQQELQIQQPGDRKSEAQATARISALYSLVTFSTGCTLEDDFPISWYKIRPYELLEMHLAGSVVTLPRQIMVEYVKPYFEAKVKSLRVVWKERDSGLGVASLGVGTSDSSGRKIHKGRRGRSRSMDPLSSAGSDRLNVDTDGNGKGKKKRTRLEWKDRRVVIHQGVLNLCKNRMDTNPTHRISLSALLALRGAEHLTRGIPKPDSTGISNSNTGFSFGSNPSSNPTSPISTCMSADTGPRVWADANVGAGAQEDTDEFVVCAKFKFKEKDPAKEADKGKRIMVRPGPRPLTAGADNRKPERGRGREERDGDNGDGEWIVLDMLEHGAFSSFLRILHRHSPLSVPSSFLPTSAGVSTYPSDFATTTPIRSNTAPSMSPSSSPSTSLRIPPISTTTSSASTSAGPTPTAPTPTQNSTSHPLSISSLLNPSASPTSSPTTGTLGAFGTRSLGALPYPEWRLRTVRKAHQAGMGDVGKAMEWVLRSDNQSSDMFAKQGDTNHDDTDVKNGVVGKEPENDEEGTEDSSELEWEGWAMDLERQSRCRQDAEKGQPLRTIKPLSTKAEDAAAGSLVLPSSPISTSSESEFPYKPHSFSSTLDSPAITSAFAPASPTAIEHHGTTAGAHHNHQYHPYSFAPPPVLPLGEGEGEGIRPIPIHVPMPMMRMRNTITSTVSVGETAVHPAPSRRRSSTVIVTSGMGSRLLRKRDTVDSMAPIKLEDDQEQKVTERARGREEERSEFERGNLKGKGKGKEERSTIKGNAASRESRGKRPKLALVFPESAISPIASGSSDRNIGSQRLMQSVNAISPYSSHSPPTSLKHARSQSNLPLEVSKFEVTAEEYVASPSSSVIRTRETGNNAGIDAAAGPAPATGGSRGKTRMRIVKGVSVQAGRFARGLDSALDFVDGRVGFGAI